MHKQYPWDRFLKAKREAESYLHLHYSGKPPKPAPPIDFINRQLKWLKYLKLVR